MKHIKYILGLMSILLTFSCTKEKIEHPAFEVSTEKTEYNVGDSITFKFSGDADIISFYSGETGKEYRYKDRTESNTSKLNLNISTQVLYGAQTDNLHLMYSTNFNNTYSAEGIAAATWTDITSRFTLSSSAANGVGAVTPSGDVDLSDLPVSGKPIYFAFKYVGQTAVSAATGQRTWRIPVFNLTNKNASGSLSIATVTTAGWLAIDVLNAANKWTIQSTTPFLFFTPASTLLPSEDWVITGALFPNSVSPDMGKGIKTYLDPIADYKYAFSAPGTYTITFVATNANDAGIKSIVKELTIVIK